MPAALPVPRSWLETSSARCSCAGPSNDSMAPITSSCSMSLLLTGLPASAEPGLDGLPTPDFTWLTGICCTEQLLL